MLLPSMDILMLPGPGSSTIISKGVIQGGVVSGGGMSKGIIYNNIAKHAP
jgi:hypothetical protein